MEVQDLPANYLPRADLLAEKGLDVDRRKIVLAEAIKTTGEHTVAIRLRSDVVAEFTVSVTAAE